MGKPLGNLCMHVAGKSSRGAAFCLASGPCRPRETKIKVNFMLLDNFSSLSSRCFTAVFSWRHHLRGTNSVRIQILGSSSASLFLEEQTRPLSRGSAESLFWHKERSVPQKENGSRKGTFPCFVTHRICIDMRVNRKAAQVPAGAEREQNKSSDVRKDLEWWEWKEGQCEVGRGKRTGRRGANVGKGGNKRKRREGRGEPGERKRDCKVTKTRGQRAVLGGGGGTGVSAERAQHVQLDRSGLLQAQPSWSTGSARV